jgi:hypothetical protein
VFVARTFAKVTTDVLQDVRGVNAPVVSGTPRISKGIGDRVLEKP